MGIHILKQLDDNEHYFHFLQSILSNYSKLDESQKKKIRETMCIQPEIITKEKIVYKEKKGQKQKQKPKLNLDDY